MLGWQEEDRQMNASDQRFNLVDLVKDQLSGGVLAKLPEILGTTQTSANTAVSAAVPALLAALGSMASTPDGSRKLASAVDGFDERTVSNLPQALSSGGTSLIDLGTGLLGNLLGSGALSGLSGVLGRFVGLDSGKTSSLLALLAPIVLGLLKSRTQGQGAAGLTRLFEGQKQNIMNAMPSGLSTALAGISGIGALSDWAGGTAGAAPQAGRAAVYETAGTARATAAAGRSALSWVLPVLAALIVLGLLWWWFAGRTTTVTTPPIGTDRVAVLTGQVTDFFRSATDTLTGIKDTASAEAAIPKLRDLSSRLDSLRAGMDQLPLDLKARIAALIKDQGAKLTPVFDSIFAMPVVGDRLKPLIDELRTKMNTLASA
jgi:Bacterial protein of unknown function (DUF937)